MFVDIHIWKHVFSLVYIVYDFVDVSEEDMIVFFFSTEASIFSFLIYVFNLCAQNLTSLKYF